VTGAVVVCTPVAEAPDPPSSSAYPVECLRCNVMIWFDLTPADLADVDEVQPYCVGCAPTDIPVSITARQMAELRAHGATDLDIAHVLAIVEITNGNAGAVPAIEAEIARNPHGPTATHYRERLADALVSVIEAKP
jgi:hypothetical protein